MNRRTALSVLGTGIVAGLAGCSVLGADGTVVEDERAIDLDETDLAESELHGVVADVRDTFGTSGVWGRDGGEPRHELTLQGAWTATLSLPAGARSRHLLALYRLPPAADGTQSSQVWLWSGVDPADAGRVLGVRAGVSLPSSASLGIYSPAQDFQATSTDHYGVESGRLDAATLAATFPIERGAVGVGEHTRIGDGGAYYHYWEGESETAVGLAATTEVRWDGASDRDLTWSFAVETD